VFLRFDQHCAGKRAHHGGAGIKRVDLSAADVAHVAVFAE